VARREAAEATRPDRPRVMAGFVSPPPGDRADAGRARGEPHPANLLSTSRGPLFVDLGTCCRGPVESDVGDAPEEVAEHYPGCDHDLIRRCRVLTRPGSTRRWRHDDHLPDGHYWRMEELNQVQAGLDRHGLDRA
jgi:hypothetical protein